MKKKTIRFDSKWSPPPKKKQQNICLSSGQTIPKVFVFLFWRQAKKSLLHDHFDKFFFHYPFLLLIRMSSNTTLSPMVTVGLEDSEAKKATVPAIKTETFRISDWDHNTTTKNSNRTWRTIFFCKTKWWHKTSWTRLSIVQSVFWSVWALGNHLGCNYDCHQFVS